MNTQKIKTSWETLAEKQSWLKKSAKSYFENLNLELSNTIVEGNLEFIVKSWEYYENEFAPCLRRTISLDLINGQILIYLNKQDYEGKWENNEKTIDKLSIKNIRLIASKMPEVLTFFENKINEKIEKIDESIAFFEKYK